MYYCGKTLINNCITWIISLINMNWIELKKYLFFRNSDIFRGFSFNKALIPQTFRQNYHFCPVVLFFWRYLELDQWNVTSFLESLKVLYCHPHCSTYSRLIFQNWMRYTWLYSLMTRPFSHPILRRMWLSVDCRLPWIVWGTINIIGGLGWTHLKLRLFSLLNAEHTNCPLRNCYLMVIQSHGRTVPNILA
jgi:hypothetical protein